jgi:hypothetical protein
MESKFDELVQMVSKYHREGNQYRQRSENAMEKIITGFVEYLEAPAGIVRYFPYADYNSDAQYSPRQAIKTNDDGWWDAGLSVLIDGTYIGFRFRMFTDEDKFQVRIGDSEKLHEFTMPNLESLAPIWDEAFNRSRMYLEGGLRRFLDATRPLKSGKIGFVV